MNRGELSPRMWGRIDLDYYNQGCEVLENLLPLPQGGITRRSGTRYVGSTKGHTAETLLPFQFSIEQAYAISYGDRYCRFYSDRGQLVVESTGTAISNGVFDGGLADWSDVSTGGSALIQATTGTVMIPRTEGDIISNGMVNPHDAFDGSLDQVGSVSARKVNSSVAWLGKSWSAPRALTGFKLFGTSNSGFRVDEDPSLEIRLEGSNTADFDRVATLWRGTIRDKDRAQVSVMSGIDESLTHQHHRVVISGGSKTRDCVVAELQFFEREAGGSLQLVGDDGEIAGAQQIITVAEADFDKVHVLTFESWSDNPFDDISVEVGADPGGTDFLEKTLQVGSHALEFTPQTSPIYLRLLYEGAGKVTIDNVSIMSAEPLELQTHYPPASLPNLKQVQSADTQWLVDGLTRPQLLLRNGAASWSMVPVRFKDGPYLDQNTTVSREITASAVTGVITLTANFPAFRPGDVGAVWRIGATGGVPGHRTWEPALAVVSGDHVVYEGNVYRTSEADDTGTTAPVHERGTVSDGEVDWTFVNRGGWGVVIVTDYTNRGEVTARVLTRLDPSALDGTSAWRRPAFSDRDGWPTMVGLHEDRLIFGRGQRIYLSRTGLYDDFRPGSEDDDGLALKLSGRQANAGLWLQSVDQLMIGTAGGPWVIKSSSDNEPLTPANANAKVRGDFGAADVDATLSDDAVLFVGYSGRKIWEMGYSLEADGYRGIDLTIVSDHILGSGCEQVVWAREPYGVLWCRRTDGDVAALTYLRTEKVIAWSRHQFSGTVLSMCVVPGKGAGAAQDELWLVVEREINGAVVRYVEFMVMPPPGGDLEPAWLVDCGIEYDGEPEDVLAGLDHLEGQTVRVQADQADQADQTVSAGRISLDEPASRILVGLPLPYRYKSLKIAEGGALGPAVGAKRRLTGLTVGLVDTGELQLGPSFDRLEPVQFRVMTDFLSTAVPLFSGEKAANYPSGWDLDPRICIAGSGTLPLTVTHISVDDLETNEQK
jgi:hypothetical protein